MSVPSLTPPARAHAPRRDRQVLAWALYDWANSAFPTLVVTFVYSTYFTQAIASDALSGTSAWAWAMAFSGGLVALLSPVVGASADRRRARRTYLAAATALCALATAAATFVGPGVPHAAVLALTFVALANVAFEIGMVLYNSFLPGLAPPERLGRVSGFGWGLGYAGGLACLVVALLVLVRPDPLFGVSTELGFNYRATNLLVAGWFAVFSLPMLLGVPEPPAAGTRREGGAGGTFRELARTLRQVREYRDIVRFLAARLVYNDGLVTVFAFGGIYAAGTFGMTLEEVIRFGIAINVAAGLGAWGFGFVDDRVGARTTVLITLAALGAFTFLAVVAPSKGWLWVAALGIGFFVGPNQSASRSLMSRLVPGGRQSEFFGFFAFSGKVTAFTGPFLLGAVTAAAGSQRAGVATVLAFFAIGAVLLVGVNEQRGIARAREG